MSKQRARQPALSGISGYETSIPRCVVAALLVVLGIVWIVVYINVAMDAAHYVDGLGLAKPSNPIPAMADLKDWNFLIGFGLIFAGLIVAADQAHPARPRPRRRGRDARLLPDRPGLGGRLLLRRRRHAHPADAQPRPEEPARSASPSWRSASPSPPSGSEPQGSSYTPVVLHRVVHSWG